MLDFGDFSPGGGTNHIVTLTAYNANNVVVTKTVLNYISSLDLNTSPYGDLHVAGDAITATAGQPGNWTWNISGTGIVKLSLDFGAGYDSNIALDLLSFTTQCP
jgi:hypothetical protein